MAAYDPTPLFDALESKMAASGWLPVTDVGEPTDPPADKMGVVMWSGARITQVHGTVGSGVISFILRFYYKAFATPYSLREKEIARATLSILNDLTSDFDLGDASVRNIVPLDSPATAGFQDVGGVMYRLSDMRIEVLVNDFVTFTQ